MLNRKRLPDWKILVGVVILAAAAFTGVLFLTEKAKQIQSTDTKRASSTPTAFLMETFTKVEKHFWKDLSEKRLVRIFKQGVGRLASTTSMSARNKKQLRAELQRVINQVGKKRRDTFPAELADLVLKSLPPQGRSRLYTQQKERQLSKRVENADSKKNLYDILDVSESADEQKISQAYKKETEELQSRANATNTDKKLQQLDYAKNVLSDSEDRSQYNQTKAEPTVFTERISEDIVHLSINRYNRDTLNEFQEAVTSVEMTPKPSSLILDLRSNLGGSIDILPYLLGPFIGPDRVAYEFFQQGEEETFRTKTGWMDALVPYKKVVILVNEKTQSTGELMASVLKKFNVGTVVGTTTRGWGTVERVIPINNQYRSDKEYSLFLVHHLTVRSDGQPIQDRGIVPEVTINDSNWKEKLRLRIPHTPLIQATEEVWNKPPAGTQID